MENIKSNIKKLPTISDDNLESTSWIIGLVYFHLMMKGYNGQEVQTDQIIYPEEYWNERGVTAEQVRLIIKSLDNGLALMTKIREGVYLMSCMNYHKEIAYS